MDTTLAPIYFFQQALLEHLKQARQNQPRLSLRKFAKKINMNSGAVSLVLQGKRGLSVKSANHIAEALSLGITDKIKFIDSVVQYRNDKMFLGQKNNTQTVWERNINIPPCTPEDLNKTFSEIKKKIAAEMAEKPGHALLIMHIHLKKAQ